MYSNSASHQLAKIAIHIGRLLNLRCPYQAAVMKQFDRIRRPIVGSALIMRASVGFVAADRNENHSRKTLLSRTYRRGGSLGLEHAIPPPLSSECYAYPPVQCCFPLCLRRLRLQWSHPRLNSANEPADDRLIYRESDGHFGGAIERAVLVGERSVLDQYR